MHAPARVHTLHTHTRAPLLQMTGEQRNGSLWLALNLPLPFIKSSLVTLSVAADDVQLVVNRAPARILSAKVRGKRWSAWPLFGVRACMEMPLAVA